MELIYRLKSQSLPQTEFLPHYIWVIKQSFSFENRNHLTLRLHLSKQILPGSHLPYTQYVWLDFLVTILSIGSLLLTFKYIYEVAFLYNDKRVKRSRDTYKEAYKQQQEAYLKFRKRNKKYRDELSSVHSVRNSKDSEDSSLSNPVTTPGIS